jgi:hypothetical protein
MKLKGQRFETVSDLQREPQEVLDSINENGFHSCLNHGENDGIIIYVPKETILKEIAAKSQKLSQHFFLDLIWEFSNKPHMLYDVQHCKKWKEIHIESPIFDNAHNFGNKLRRNIS